MKKKILSLLLFFLAISSVFSLSIQAESFSGTSNGLNAGIVFGNNYFKHTAALIYEFRNLLIVSNGLNNGGIPYEDETPYLATYYGLFYKFSFDTTFFNIGSVGLGVDIGIFASVGIDSIPGVYDINCNIGLTPAVKIVFNKFDFVTGWRGVVFTRHHAADSTSRLKNSFTVGVRFSISGRSSIKQNTQQSSQQTPGYDFNPIVKRIE